ncbi:MAG: hypothetical protein WB779_06675 [Ignavibacteriaceae bacterium]|jgi:hypothetical protein
MIKIASREERGTFSKTFAIEYFGKNITSSSSFNFNEVFENNKGGN